MNVPHSLSPLSEHILSWVRPSHRLYLAASLRHIIFAPIILGPTIHASWRCSSLSAKSIGQPTCFRDTAFTNPRSARHTITGIACEEVPSCRHLHAHDLGTHHRCIVAFFLPKSKSFSCLLVRTTLANLQRRRTLSPGL